MIPAHSSTLHITGHGLSDILIIFSCAFFSAFYTNWIGAYLWRIEVTDCLAVTVAWWVVSVEPLSFAVCCAAGASGIINGASRTQEPNSVISTISVTLIAVLANKTNTRLASHSLSCITTMQCMIQYILCNYTTCDFFFSAYACIHIYGTYLYFDMIDQT